MGKLSTLIENGVRVRFIGDRKFFPDSVKSCIEEAEEKTKHLDTLNFNLMFCYPCAMDVSFKFII